MMYPSLHRVMGSSFEVPVWFILGLRSRVHRLVDVVVDRVVDHGAPARRLLPHRRDVRQRLTDQRSLSVSGMPGAMRQVGGKTAPGNGRKRDVRTCTSSSCSSLLSDAASSASAHVAPTPRGATEGHVSGKETGASGNMARVGLMPATEKTRRLVEAGWRARTTTKNGC